MQNLSNFQLLVLLSSILSSISTQINNFLSNLSNNSSSGGVNTGSSGPIDGDTKVERSESSTHIALKKNSNKVVPFEGFSIKKIYEKAVQFFNGSWHNLGDGTPTDIQRRVYSIFVKDTYVRTSINGVLQVFANFYKNGVLIATLEFTRVGTDGSTSVLFTDETNTIDFDEIKISTVGTGKLQFRTSDNDSSPVEFGDDAELITGVITEAHPSGSPVIQL